MLLEITPLAHARAEVLTPTQRSVSWVHSSEIYEIAPLLDGGEVLLTTGLGLVGADDTALTHYVEGIAASGAAALVLELGRTFVHPPPALVAACTRTGLGLIVLHAVVPFVRIARVCNERILDHEAHGLRRAAEVSRALTTALTHRTGLRSMVAQLADHAATPLQLVDVDGKVHAGPATLADPTLTRDLELTGGTWGHLVATETGDPHLGLLLDRGVEALQVAVADLHGSRRRDATRTLLLDLVRGSLRGVEDVARRAAALGVPADREVTALVAVPGERPDRQTVAAMVDAIRRTVRTDLVAMTDDGLLAVTDAAASRRRLAADLLAAVDTAVAPSRARLRHLAVGTPVARLDLVPAAFGVALVGAATARTLRSTRRLLLPTDIALERVLLETDDAVLERLVERVLGPLLDHDATRRADLLPTLVAYLDTGRSKAAAAKQLGVRRQTVHERLDRLTSMLDLSADDPTLITTVEVAVRAWQVRTAGARDHGSPR